MPKIVRCIWGLHNDNVKSFSRRSKIDKDIYFLQNTKYNLPFITYVFGKNNYDYIKSLNLECVKISNDPFLWDMNTQQYRHKLEIFKRAVEDHGEIIFLDWDTIQIKPLPFDFWSNMKSKGSLQASLRQYVRPKATWRSKDRRKIPCASFVYINNQSVSLDLIKMWEKEKMQFSEEVILAKYTDNLHGGWKDIDFYWEKFEPNYFAIGEQHYPIINSKRNIVSDRGSQIYFGKKYQVKDVCFNHVDAILQEAILNGKINKPDWCL